jgi:pyocin large subunit-like protein
LSIHAVSWAMKCRLPKVAEKFLLVCLANYADENGRCYPSIAALEYDTSMNRKTIIAAMKRLVDAGLVMDTGQRVGKTRQIPVYQINMTAEYSAENGIVDDAENNTETGTVPKTEQSQKVLGNSPKNGTRNRQEPSDNITPLTPHCQKSEFDRFWEAYPKRRGANPRKPAEQKFRAAVKRGTDPAEIVRGAERYAAELRDMGKLNTEFVAHAATWLNQERWSDYGPSPPSLQADADAIDRQREALKARVYGEA